MVLAEDFDRLHAAFDAGALVTHLGDERWPGSQGFADNSEFVELLNERFLSVEVFVVLECGHHHWGVVKVWCFHDDGIEIAQAVREGLAIIFFAPCLRKLGSHFCEFARVNVREAGPLDVGMVF